jgi:hypothetical protein
MELAHDSQGCSAWVQPTPARQPVARPSPARRPPARASLLRASCFVLRFSERGRRRGPERVRVTLRDSWLFSALASRPANAKSDVQLSRYRYLSVHTLPYAHMRTYPYPILHCTHCTGLYANVFHSWSSPRPTPRGTHARLLGCWRLPLQCTHSALLPL